MVHADLAVLGGVGILALVCLAVCCVYLYWASDTYRSRQRRLEFEAQILKPPLPNKQKSDTRTIPQNNEAFSGATATMGTQLSHRCKTSLFRAVFNAAHGESIVYLIADNRDDARTRFETVAAGIGLGG